jgi:pilus assembly protein Flp/PilA
MNLFNNLSSNNERGQGLVEYALILVLVAVVVVGILLTLGPAVGQVFSRINVALGSIDSGVITSAEAARTGGGNGNDVEVTITVSANTPVTVSDSQNASPQTITCTGSCVVTLSGVGPAAGTATVSADAGGTAIAPYDAKN